MKPFKLSHESWLDSVSVCMLMAIFVADVQKSFVDDGAFGHRRLRHYVTSLMQTRVIPYVIVCIVERVSMRPFT